MRVRPQIRRYRLAALGVLVVASTAVGALLVMQASDSAESGITPFRLCNTVVPLQAGGPKGGIEVTGLARTSGGTPGRPDYREGISLIIKREIGQGESSSLVLDPRDGRVIRDDVKPDGRGQFDAILAGVKIEPLALAAAPWPYSDKDKGEPVSAGSFRYVPSAEGTGLIEVFESINGNPGGQILHLVNCRSQLDINVTVSPSGDVQEGVVTDWVDPADKEAFQRFADEVSVSSKP